MKDIEELRRKVAGCKAVIFDSDGVLVEEGHPIDGAIELFEFLIDADKIIIVLSNNSTKHPKDMKENYHQKGLKVDRIINSSMITANYCNEQGYQRLYVVGEPGLIELFQEEGLIYTTKNVDAVVVGMDRDVTYQKLAIATQLIRDGVPFLGTNPDPSFPTPRGLEPGAGSMIAAIEASTGKKVDKILGKPAVYGYQMVLEKYNLKHTDCLMIGDRFETDIIGALDANIPAIIVNTGIAATRDTPGKYEGYQEVPVIENLRDLISKS